MVFPAGWQSKGYILGIVLDHSGTHKMVNDIIGFGFLKQHEKITEFTNKIKHLGPNGFKKKQSAQKEGAACQ